MLDARRAVAWLKQQGYDRVGILGTSLGLCLSLLTATHEPHVNVLALNHVSSWFGDVVWEGLSTAHVQAGLEGSLDIHGLRDLWRPVVSPKVYMHKVGDRPALFVYALWDLSFPLHLSKDIIEESRRCNVPTTVRVLPCGHYTTGKAPFKFHRRLLHGVVPAAAISDGRPFVEVPEDALEGVVEDAGEGLHKRGHLAGFDRVGHRHRVGDEQPDCRARQDGRITATVPNRLKTQADDAHGLIEGQPQFTPGTAAPAY